MNKFLIGLTLLTSLSSFAQDPAKHWLLKVVTRGDGMGMDDFYKTKSCLLELDKDSLRLKSNVYETAYTLEITGGRGVVRKLALTNINDSEVGVITMNNIDLTKAGSSLPEIVVGQDLEHSFFSKSGAKLYIESIGSSFANKYEVCMDNEFN